MEVNQACMSIDTENIETLVIKPMYDDEWQMKYVSEIHFVYSCLITAVTEEQCNICGKICKSRSALYAHRSLSHRDAVRKYQKPTKYFD